MGFLKMGKKNLHFSFPFLYKIAFPNFIVIYHNRKLRIMQQKHLLNIKHLSISYSNVSALRLYYHKIYIYAILFLFMYCDCSCLG